MKLKNDIVLALALGAAFTTSVTEARPMREWDWHMPGSVYKMLEFTDRAAVDRAVKLFQQAVDAEDRGTKVTDLIPRYRAAAGEWKKVEMQGETEEFNPPLLAYAVFMQGYARQQAHDRNEAAKLYNNVLDLYPEQKFIAVPAKFMLYQIDRSVGDTKKALAALDELIDDKEAVGHVLYANIVRDRAGFHWSKKEFEDAIELWKKLVFAEKRPDHWIWTYSRDDLIRAYLITGNFADYGAAVYAGIAPEKKKDRAQRLTENANWVSDIDAYGHHGVTQTLDWLYPRDKKASERTKALRKIVDGYAAWFASESAVYAEIGDEWSPAWLDYRIHRRIDKQAERDKRLQKLVGMAKGAKEDGTANGRLNAIIGEMCSMSQWDSARSTALLVRGHLNQLRTQWGIEEKAGQYKAMVQYMEEFVGTKPPPEPGQVKEVRYSIAWNCTYRLSEHDKAAKIYQDLDDPPRSLWGLSEALRRGGKKDQSYSTLTEIASIFPKDAPEAILRMARWREDDGQKDKAIALYRRLLSQPEWKQLGQSSAAHQALERLGIATGGAMINTVR